MIDNYWWLVPSSGATNTVVYTVSKTKQYQRKPSDGEQCFKATVEEEGTEQSETVIPQMFEGQLENVSPANASKVNLFCRPVGGATQGKKLWEFNEKREATVERMWNDVSVWSRSHNDHSQEGEAHEDALHLDEQHGSWKYVQNCGVKSRDQATDGSTWGEPDSVSCFTNV